ncbi:MAG: ferrous-iron efflux pump FieF [Myxococcota bacterium]
MENLEPSERQAELRRVTAVAIAVPVGLALLKAVAFFLSGSVAVLSSLVDSLMDVAVSSMNKVAVRIASKPPDAEHRFGHGKAEAVAGLMQGAFVLGSAVFVVVEALPRLANPVLVKRPYIAIAVMGIAIVATLALVSYQKRVARRTGSVAVAADALHYTADILMHAAVIVGIVIVEATGWPYADPLLGIVIAVILTVGAFKITRQSLDQLLDRELSEEERARIIDIASADADVIDAHDLRTRTAGGQTFIQLHLTIAHDQTLHDAHEAGVRVQNALGAAFQGADILIHHDPSAL